MPVPSCTRRRALQCGVLGVISSVSGCTNLSDEGGTADTPTVTALPMGDTATSSNGVSVAISEPEVYKIILTPREGSSVHMDPAGDDSSQFLVFSVSTERTDITTVELTPVIDDNRYERQIYSKDFDPGNAGKMGLQIPIVAAEEGVIEWRTSSGEQFRWTLPESILEDLRNSPKFEVTRFDVPDEINSRSPFTGSVTVTNTGGRDGRFMAMVVNEGSTSIPLLSKFSTRISIDKTVTEDFSGREIEEESSEITAILDWGTESMRSTFTVTE